MNQSQHASGQDQGTRREFLKRSVVVTAAATVPSLAIARSAHAAGDAAIKIGMIGCGGRCSGAGAQALNTGPDVKLVAMCDVFDSRLQAARTSLAKKFPEQVAVDDEHCFTDFNGYQKVIDSADAVLIACASKFHPMYAEAAVKAGKHVFVEKPHGIDPAGVHRMENACRLAQEKGVSLVSGLQSRYHAGWQETVARIHDGAIGDVVAVQSMFLRAPYRVYERPEGMAETEYQFYNWYHFRWLSGDDVPQSLVHNVDRISWILHEQSPKWCFGLAGRSASFGTQFGDMFDHHTVVYEYESGPRLYALCRTEAGCYGSSNDLIMGAKGTCNLQRCQIEGETNWQFEGQRNDPYQAEQQAYTDSIRKGTPINSGSYMNHSTMIGVLGQIACYSGKATTWDEAYKSNFQYNPGPDEANFQTKPPSVPDATGNYPLPRPGITKLL